MQQLALSRLYERQFGSPPVTILPLEGDGSSRTMYRLVGQAYETAIGVIGPDQEENQACLSFSRALRGAGLPVPEIYQVTSEASGLLFTNDTLPVKIRDWWGYGVSTYIGIGKNNVAA